MSELELASELMRWAALACVLYQVRRWPHGWTVGLLVLTSLLLIEQVGVRAFALQSELPPSARLVYRLGSFAISALLLGGAFACVRALGPRRPSVPDREQAPPRARDEAERRPPSKPTPLAAEEPNQTLRARARQQEALANLGRRILASASLGEALDDAVHTVARTLRVSGSSIFEFAFHRRSLVLRSGAGRMSDYLGVALSAGRDSYLGQALSQEQRVIVSDLDEAPLLRPQLLPYAQARSAIAVVIPGRDRPLGVLAAHAAEASRFTDEDAHFIQGVANLISATMEQERTRAELDRGRERALQAQKLQALGRLSGGIAHDLNNVLHAIVGNTELALRRSNEDSVAANNLRQVLTAAQRARALIQQVLTFSLQGRPERTRVEIESIVDEVVVLMRGCLPKDVRIYKTVLLPSATVVADSTQLYQVLVNLCTNAGHAMPESGGEIEVSIDGAYLSADEARDLGLEEGRYILLSVRDTGHGIPSEIRDRIFDPFFSASGVAGSAREGTGMGLAVVHGIVDAHHGHVRVESDPGEGARFDVFLPQSEESAPESTASEAQLSSSRPASDDVRVLFVDDEPALVLMTEQGLGGHGFEVTGMQSSTRALEVFRQDPFAFDVVVMDQNMPELCGDALAKELIQIRHDIPIVLCTGYANEVTPEELQAIGVREYLNKPLAIDHLANVVRRAARSAAH